MIDILFTAGHTDQAQKLLDDMPAVMASQDACDAAILAHRLGRQETAHKYFERAGDALLTDARGLHEFAQTKIKLAEKLRYEKNRNYKLRREAKPRLLREARELLERVLKLEADPVRHAWAWRVLGRVRKWLKAPAGSILAAYHHAVALLPDEPKFHTEIERLSGRTGRRAK